MVENAITEDNIERKTEREHGNNLSYIYKRASFDRE